MSAYKDSYMTESQFAQFLGKSRLYQYLPVEQKKRLPQMLMTDTQIGLVAKAYYNDRSLNATQLTEGLNKALYGENEYSWFIQ